MLKEKYSGLKYRLKIFRCLVRRRFLSRTTVIAITGSCGKTSATRFLGKILSDDQPCHVGIDQNSLQAICKSIKKTKCTHKFLVQETAVDAPGNMAEIMPLLQPDIGIVTTIGQDHYANFRTLEATAEEKVLLIKSLSENGVAVLNADDPHVIAMAEHTRGRVISYGYAEHADVRATDIHSAWPKRLSLTVTFQKESVRIETGLFGDLLTISILAAVAGAMAVGISLKQCARSLKAIEPFNGRMSIHHFPLGSWIINDSFKAPYWSVEKVVSLLKDVEAPRKTLVLGSFSDTPGSGSPKYRRIAKLGLAVADRVILVGKKAFHVRKMLSPELANRLFVVDSVEKACQFLAQDVVTDELVLIKSNGREHLERLIYGQLTQLNCWKDTCSEKKSCKICEKSGLS